jgi:lysophospholipase L1-like esterase
MILDVCPNVKIKLLSYPIQSLRGGMGSNYGAISPTNDSLRKIHFNMVLGKTYKNLVEEEKYKNNLEYINISGQFDSEYGYPHIFKPVNTRSKEVEWFDINGVHPSNDGYMQIADAVYRNLIKECFSEKE